MESMDPEKLPKEKIPPTQHSLGPPDSEHDPMLAVNASGHTQETLRHFGLLSLLSIGVAQGNTWAGLGGTIVVAIYNGGPPGVIYEFIVACIFYGFIAASIAELASAMPSSGGVYHFASVCGGRKYGRVLGFFAGWWNLFMWIFGLAAISAIAGNLVVAMYGVFHPEFEPKPWHVFVCYLFLTWIGCFTVLFFNEALPIIEQISMVIVAGGVFVTILVCAIMPKVNRRPYATNNFVWKDWENQTGWSSNGFVFVSGMLNGAFSFGFPDIVTHLAEEIPRPSINVPLAILYQNLIGFLTGLLFLISILYAVTDLDAVLNSPVAFPLTEIYHQATGSAGGTFALVLVIFFSSFASVVGSYITAGRMYWALSRDNATPFAATFAKIDPKRKNPFNATIFIGACCTVLACIYVGSITAFNAFVGSFVIASTLSYLAAILPHLLYRRNVVEPGAFWMPGWVGWFVNGLSCVYMIAFIVIFSFPASRPVTAANMNYASLMMGGLSIFVAGLWVVKRGKYKGPMYVSVRRDSGMLARDAM